MGVNMDKEELIRWIIFLEIQGCLWKFYKSKYWMKLANEVLKEQHYECQVCLKKGILTKADTVHHVNYVKDRPDLALDKYYIDEKGIKQKNLIAVCKKCHNDVHKRFGYKEFINEERW